MEANRDTINEATKANCSLKLVTKPSKPYWAKELSSKSKELRDALGTYLTRNTDVAFERFQRAKEIFEETRKLACQQFIVNKPQNVNVAQANKFW